MILNRVERLVVNNPVRMMAQRLEIGWFTGKRPLTPGATVVEIGCGRGAGAALIQRHCRPERLHAFDLDFRMVRMAASRQATRQGTTWGVADAEDLPLRSRVADAVVGFGFLHHVPDWRRALGEVHRILRPGGVYYMEELYPELYQNAVTGRLLVHPARDRFRSRDLQQALGIFGFSSIARTEHPWIGLLGVFQK